MNLSRIISMMSALFICHFSSLSALDYQGGEISLFSGMTESFMIAKKQLSEIDAKKEEFEAEQKHSQLIYKSLISEITQTYSELAENPLIEPYLNYETNNAKSRHKTLEELIGEVEATYAKLNDHESIANKLGNNFEREVKRAVSLCALAYAPGNGSYQNLTLKDFKTKLIEKRDMLTNINSSVKEIVDEISCKKASGGWLSFYSANSCKPFSTVYNNIVDLQNRLNLTLYGFGEDAILPTIDAVKSKLGNDAKVYEVEEKLKEIIKEKGISQELEKYPQYLERQIELINSILKSNFLEPLYQVLRQNLYTSEDEILHIFLRNKNEFSGFASFVKEDHVNPNSLYLTFAGTDSVSDWLKNFQGWNETAPAESGVLTGIKIHSGFLQSFKENLGLFVNNMHSWAKHYKRQYGKAPVKVMATGHSLGGALANIYTAALVQILNENGISYDVGVISIAAPNFIHANSLKLFNEILPGNRIFTIDHKFDLVPLSVVWKTKPDGLKMYSNEFFWSDADGSFRLNPAPGQHSIDTYASDIQTSFATWHSEFKTNLSGLAEALEKLKELKEIESDYEMGQENLSRLAIEIDTMNDNPENYRVNDIKLAARVKLLIENAAKDVSYKLVSDQNTQAELRDFANKIDEKLRAAIYGTKKYSLLNPLGYIYSPSASFKDEQALFALSMKLIKLFRDESGKSQKHNQKSHFTVVSDLEQNEELVAMAQILSTLGQKHGNKFDKKFFEDIKSTEDLSRAFISKIEFYSKKNNIRNTQQADSFKTLLELFRDFIETVDEQAKNVSLQNGQLTSSSLILLAIKTAAKEVAKTSDANLPVRKVAISNEAINLLGYVDMVKNYIPIMTIIDHYFMGTLNSNMADSTVFKNSSIIAIDSSLELDSDDKTYWQGVKDRMDDFMKLCDYANLPRVKDIVEILIRRNQGIIKAHELE